MKHIVALSLVIAYYIAVDAADWDIQSTLGMAFVYVFIPLVFIPFFSYGVFAALRAESKGKAHKAALESTGFIVTHELPSMYLDATNQQLAVHVVDPTSGEIKHWVVKFKDILGTAVVQDGRQVTSTSTGSLLGRALVGGVVLGGIGALLGGLTAKSHSEDRIKKLVLEVVLNAPAHPIHRLTYLDAPEGVSPDSALVRFAAEKMEFAQALLELAMMGETIPTASSTREIQDTLRMLQLRAKRT